MLGRTGPSTLGGRYFGHWVGFDFATHCDADQRTRNAATSAFWEHAMQQNAPDPAGGDYNAPPDPLACFKGAASWRRGGGGRERRGSEREESGREGGEREGKLILMRSWNWAADWLRPALDNYDN